MNEFYWPANHGLSCQVILWMIWKHATYDVTPVVTNARDRHPIRGAHLDLAILWHGGGTLAITCLNKHYFVFCFQINVLASNHIFVISFDHIKTHISWPSHSDVQSALDGWDKAFNTSRWGIFFVLVAIIVNSEEQPSAFVFCCIVWTKNKKERFIKSKLTKTYKHLNFPLKFDIFHVFPRVFFCK